MTRTGRSLLLPAIALAAAVAAGTAAAGTAVVEDVKSPRGPTSRILVEKPANAWVTLLVFTGGQGDLRISDGGEINNMRGNFLIRTSGDFVAAGAVTAIIDAPSDRSNLSNFRDTEGHAQDVGAVIRHLKAKFKLPVWVMGHSNGTTSAANAVVRLTGDARPDGAVVAASRFVSNAYGTSVLDLDLGKITGPMLIVHHKHDQCSGASADRVPDFRAALKNAVPAKALIYEEGYGIRSKACESRHYHGFVGIETRVVADIMAWIRNPAP